MLSAAQTGLKYIIPILYTKFLLFASEIAYIFRDDTLFFGDAAQYGCLMECLTAFMREMCVLVAFLAFLGQNLTFLIKK